MGRGDENGTNGLSARAAPLIAFGPGLLFLPGVALMNPWVMRLLSPDGALMPYTIWRSTTYAVIYLLLGVLCLVGVLHGGRAGLGRRLAAKPRVVRLLFSVNLFAVMVLGVDGAIGVKTVRQQMHGETYPDATLTFRFYPEFDRLNGNTPFSREQLRPPVDPEALPKPGVRRIVFMGDSVVYGHAVGPQQTIPYYLDQRLDPRLEVLNAGAKGYGFENYVYYAEELLELRPAQVVLGVCLNDLSLATDRRLTAPPGSPDCRVERASAWRVDWFAQSHSGLLNIRNYAERKRLEALKPPQLAGEVTESVTYLCEPGHEGELAHKAAIVRPYLKRMADLAAERDVEFLVVVFPFYFQYYEPAIERWPNHAVLQETLVEVCESVGVRVVDLRPPIGDAMLSRGLSVDDVFLDYDHFAPKGCELVAELIAPHVRR